MSKDDKSKTQRPGGCDEVQHDNDTKEETFLDKVSNIMQNPPEKCDCCGTPALPTVPMIIMFFKGKDPVIMCPQCHNQAFDGKMQHMGEA